MIFDFIFSRNRNKMYWNQGMKIGPVASDSRLVCKNRQDLPLPHPFASGAAIAAVGENRDDVFDSYVEYVERLPCGAEFPQFPQLVAPSENIVRSCSSSTEGFPISRRTSNAVTSQSNGGGCQNFVLGTPPKGNGGGGVESAPSSSATPTNSSTVEI